LDCLSGSHLLLNFALFVDELGNLCKQEVNVWRYAIAVHDADLPEGRNRERLDLLDI
jgi:hypothetical protein